MVENTCLKGISTELRSKEVVVDVQQLSTTIAMKDCDL